MASLWESLSVSVPVADWPAVRRPGSSTVEDVTSGYETFALVFVYA